MLEDISNLSSDDRLHKLILDVSLKKSNWDDEEQLTDDELFSIFNLLKDRIHFITNSPNFFFTENDEYLKTTKSYLFDSLEKLSLILSSYKNCLIVFYDISKMGFQFKLRIHFYESIILIRDSKIDDILKK